MPFRVLGLDHVVFRVRDLEGMVRFYGEALGCPVDHRQERLGLVHLRVGPALVDLVRIAEGETAPRPGAGNVAHLCLRIDPWDPEALRAHFAARGIELEWVENNYGAEGTGPSAYLQDPEGNVLELKGPAGLIDCPES